MVPLQARLRCRKCNRKAESRFHVAPVYVKCTRCPIEVSDKVAQSMYSILAWHDSRRFLRNSYLSKPTPSNRLSAANMGSQSEDDAKIENLPFFAEEESEDMEDVRLW